MYKVGSQVFAGRAGRREVPDTMSWQERGPRHDKLATFTLVLVVRGHHSVAT